MRKLVIWSNSPSHYQRSFYAALRESMDIVVRYYLPLSEDRKGLGWSNQVKPELGEAQVTFDVTDALNTVPDWQNRVHIVPRDIIHAFPRNLSVQLSRKKTPWVAWGERSFKGWKWLATYPLKLWYASLVNKNASGVFAIGETAIKDYISWGIKKEKIAFLPYVTPHLSKDVTPDPKVLEFSENASLIFIFMGMLCQRKGIDILINAFAKVYKRYSGVRLVLVGSDSSNGKYKEMVTGLGLQSSVLFAGSVAPENLNRYLVQTDVVVLPSRYDGWGVVLNEGASMGKALIATETCGAAEHLIVQNYNGFRIPASNWQALAEKMILYANNQKLVQEHGYHSSIIYEKFTPEQNVKRLLNAFSKWGIK